MISIHGFFKNFFSGDQVVIEQILTQYIKLWSEFGNFLKTCLEIQYKASLLVKIIFFLVTQILKESEVFFREFIDNFLMFFLHNFSMFISVYDIILAMSLRLSVHALPECSTKDVLTFVVHELRFFVICNHLSRCGEKTSELVRGMNRH